MVAGCGLGKGGRSPWVVPYPLSVFFYSILILLSRTSLDQVLSSPNCHSSVGKDMYLRESQKWSWKLQREQEAEDRGLRDAPCWSWRGWASSKASSPPHTGTVVLGVPSSLGGLVSSSRRCRRWCLLCLPDSVGVRIRSKHPRDVLPCEVLRRCEGTVIICSPVYLLCFSWTLSSLSMGLIYLSTSRA